MHGPRVLPAGYVAGERRGALVVALAEAWAAVAAAVDAAGSLFDWAAGRPDARALLGRGTAYAVPAPGGGWVVRHYRRGGAMARWLGDRYARLGESRPLAELRASVAARERGVPTPEVVGLVVYPAGRFYRADIATREVPGARDLAAALWAEPPAGAEERLAACGAAGRLLRLLGERGVVHRDLNVKNILLEGEPARPGAWVLDLDGCRIVRRASWRQRRAMRSRLRRSVRKWEARTGRRLTEAERMLLDG
ncbi:MAG: hypothetical protein IRZ00_09260 [Gemmatimonadetes bacterium]|nr:hypothetical protein [Gemmatimonadota bacterium]